MAAADIQEPPCTFASVAVDFVAAFDTCRMELRPLQTLGNDDDDDDSVPCAEQHDQASQDVFANSSISHRSEASSATEGVATHTPIDTNSRLDEGETATITSIEAAPNNPLKQATTPEGLTSEAHASTSGGCSFNSVTKMLRCPPHGSISIIGRRREMEDEVAVIPKFISLPTQTLGGCSHLPQGPGASSSLHFFGVYDGHGGIQVAKFCKDYLHQALADEIQIMTRAESFRFCDSVHSVQDQWETVMNSCFLRVDMEVGGFRKMVNYRRDDLIDCCTEIKVSEAVGSTAIVAVVGACQIVVANCGDSRAVLSRGGHAIALSVDHKPDREDEMNRIEASGGRVICWNGYRVFGVLAMSRAIGDRYLKPYVISDPEVTYTQRSVEDDCLILASDGLWDVLSNDEVCEAARHRLAYPNSNKTTGRSSSAGARHDENAEAAASLLAKMAIAKGSSDNISVVVVNLRDWSTLLMH